MVNKKRSKNYLTFLENEKKQRHQHLITAQGYVTKAGFQGKFQPYGREDGGRGSEGEVCWTNSRQPPGQPYTDGWPQLKVGLAHLWGCPLGRDLQFSHQWTSIHKACGEIREPEEWGREGESLENGRVKHSRRMW